MSPNHHQVRITPARMIRIENSLENKPFVSGFGDESVSLSSRGNNSARDGLSGPVSYIKPEACYL